MKILFWCEQFWPNIGGAELFAGRLIPALRARGHEFIVLVRRDSPDLPASASYEGVPIRRFPFWEASSGRDPAKLLEVQRQVAEVKRSFEPDLVHLNGFAPTSALFHRLTSTVSPAPMLLTLHAEHSEPGAIPDSLLARTLNEAACIVGCSDAILQSVRSTAPGRRSTVIRHGLEVPSVLPEPLPVGGPRILCLGRLSHVKGFDLALRAFAALAGRQRTARLVLAGDGEERAALEHLASDLGVRRSVDFIGWVEPDKVPSLINSAYLVAAPSRSEGFGLAALEAALMARPVVASDAGGLREVVIHNETGILVPVDDAAALAAAIERVLDDPEWAKRMGDAARRRATTEFRWEDCVDAYDAVYNDLAPRPHAATERDG